MLAIPLAPREPAADRLRLDCGEFEDFIESGAHCARGQRPGEEWRGMPV
ncbi:hypothetical protein [Mobiluncus mulieris]|nr:hypothetical protein [Mobiluncus mulieris]